MEMRRRTDVWPCSSTLVVAVLLILTACTEQAAPPDYAARVGDRYLLEEEVDQALRGISTYQDSADSRRQFVDQWVSNEVLHQEALRRGLDRDEEIVRALRQSERSILANALVEELYEEHQVYPSPSEIQTYYERHREQLRLRENFVRVRYLRTDSRDAAEDIRQLLQQADLADRDSAFTAAIGRLASVDPVSHELFSNYHPESRIFGSHPELREALLLLSDEQTAPIVEYDSSYHVIQLARRVPEGTLPEPEWIEDELVRRIIVQDRKQLYARQVQRLRNEAMAREDLELK